MAFRSATSTTSEISSLTAFQLNGWALIAEPQNHRTQVHRNGTSYTLLRQRVWQEFDFRLGVCHITNESHIDLVTYKVNKLDVFCYKIRLKPYLQVV